MPKKKYPRNELIATDSNATLEAQIGEILTKLGNRDYEWLLVTQQAIFPCEAHTHSTKESLIGDMTDALACHCLVAAVYHRGRRLPESEIVSLRTAAIDNLGTLSRASFDGLI